jgi:hypothetical protein
MQEALACARVLTYEDIMRNTLRDIAVELSKHSQIEETLAELVK